MAKPKFDPNQPFEAVGEKPKFDPSRPYETVALERALTPKELRAKYDKELLDEMGATGQFLTGMGAGFSNIGKNVADLASNVIPALAPDKAKWAEERELVQPVTNTRAGGIGEIVGEAAPLIPLGMGAGGLVRATVGRVLPKAAGALAAKFAGGAVPGYIAAGPENRGGGALVGGILNTVPVVGRVAAGAMLGGKAAGPENETAGQVAGGLTGLVAPWAYRGLVKPTPAATKLLRAGVDDMTLGQMSPRSMLAQFEEAGTSSGAGGNILKAMRKKAVEQYQKAIVNRAPAPNSGPLPEGSVPERLQAAYESYGPAYEPIKKAPVPADMGGVTMRESMGEAFRAAAENPEVLASESTRGAVNKFLQNQATILDRVRPTPWPSSPRLPQGSVPPALSGGGPPGLPAETSSAIVPAQRAIVPSLPQALAARGLRMAHPPPIPQTRGSVPAEVLLKARENIGKEISRQLSGKNPDFTTAKLLEGAEEPLTHALQTYLPEEAAAALKPVESQYANYKRIAGAVRRAGDAPEGFQPTHLSAEIKAKTPEDAYARGAGGPLRELAAAGQEVFNQRIPLTGARYLTTGPGHWFTTPMSILANMKPFKKALTGQYALQRGPASAVDWLARRRILGFSPLESIQRAAAIPSTSLLDSDKYAAQARAEALRRRAEEKRNAP